MKNLKRNLLMKTIFFLTVCFISQNTLLQTQQLPQTILIQGQLNQNLLRTQASITSNSPCLSYSGSLCSLCTQGYVLTNGKCYETIPNCLTQYTNVCSACWAGYSPYSSLTTLNSVSSYTVTCILDTIPSPNINSTNSTNSSVNPVLLLGKETFISWTNVEVRYPTDIYLVMIWNYLDGTDELKAKVKISENALQSAVQGRVNSNTERLTLINWVVQNQLTNFVEGNLIDIANILIYRIRYKSRTTLSQYEVLAMIHQTNYKITLLQQLLISPGNSAQVNNTSPTVGYSSQSQQIQALRQQILDLKMQASQQRQLFRQRQKLTLFNNQYSLFANEQMNSDPGCIVIRNHIDSNFNSFVSEVIKPKERGEIYSWMNFQIQQVFIRRTDSFREYLYLLSFTDDVRVLVQFKLDRLYAIQSIKTIYNQ